MVVPEGLGTIKIQDDIAIRVNEKIAARLLLIDEALKLDVLEIRGLLNRGCQSCEMLRCHAKPLSVSDQGISC